MAFDQPYAPVAFGFVTSITPGPNDMTPRASGAIYGVRRTVPHMLGVAIGFVVMAVLAGAGLAPGIRVGAGAVYGAEVGERLVPSTAKLKIATALPTAAGPAAYDVLAAAAFQWVNPKAWAMALTAYATHVGHSRFDGRGVTFGLANLPSVCPWAMLG